jgi:hypothetical protein
MRIFTHLSLAALVLAALMQFTVVRSVDRGAANSMAQIAQTHNAEFGGQTEASKEMIAQQRKGILREQRQAIREKVEKALGGKVTTPQIAIGLMGLGIVLWGAAVLRKEENVHHALNAVFLAVFCVIRWLNFL